MGRFSVEKNMINNAPVTQQPLQNFPALQFPATFDKFAIALDRDGIVCENRNIIDGPDSFIPIEGAFRAVAVIRSKGHKVAFLYDQPSVSHRKVKIEQVEECNRYMLKLLGDAGCISIDGIWYNTSGRKDDLYAKPNLGLFRHAEMNIPNWTIKGGMYVGDSIDDLIMAERGGATPVLILTGNGKKTQEKLQKSIYKLLLPKIKIFPTLMNFAESL